MRYYIGTDIIEIERINSEITNVRSRLERIFTKKEIEYCSKFTKSDEHYAARFAGKEAIIKAFAPCRIRLGFQDIEIINHDLGFPIAVINHDDANMYHISLSLSHSGTHAIAVALVMPMQIEVEK